MFSESSPCLLGQHGSCSTAQRPVELSKNILKNIFHNLPPQTVHVHSIRVKNYLTVLTISDYDQSFLIHCCKILQSITDLARKYVGWPSIAGKI